MSQQQIQVYVIGAGYAGLLATVRLAGKTRRQNVQITLINPSERFVERLRLHQYAANQPVRQRPIVEILRGEHFIDVRANRTPGVVHRTRVLAAAVRETEHALREHAEPVDRVHDVQQMDLRRLPGDRDRKLPHIGEVRLCLLSGTLNLPEEHLPSWTALHAPAVHSPLQRAPKRIKVAATSAGLTLKELAAQAGTTPALIYQYVRGITNVPPETLRAIAVATRVNLEFFDPDKGASILVDGKPTRFDWNTTTMRGFRSIVILGDEVLKAEIAAGKPKGR